MVICALECQQENYVSDGHLPHRSFVSSLFSWHQISYPWRIQQTNEKITEWTNHGSFYEQLGKLALFAHVRHQKHTKWLTTMAPPVQRPSLTSWLSWLTPPLLVPCQDQWDGLYMWQPKLKNMRLRDVSLGKNFSCFDRCNVPWEHMKEVQNESLALTVHLSGLFVCFLWGPLQFCFGSGNYLCRRHDEICLRFLAPSVTCSVVIIFLSTLPHLLFTLHSSNQPIHSW